MFASVTLNMTIKMFSKYAAMICTHVCELQYWIIYTLWSWFNFFKRLFYINIWNFVSFPEKWTVQFIPNACQHWRSGLLDKTKTIRVQQLHYTGSRRPTIQVPANQMICSSDSIKHWKENDGRHSSNGLQLLRPIFRQGDLEMSQSKLRESASGSWLLSGWNRVAQTLVKRLFYKYMYKSDYKNVFVNIPEYCRVNYLPYTAQKHS